MMEMEAEESGSASERLDFVLHGWRVHGSGIGTRRGQGRWEKAKQTGVRYACDNMAPESTPEQVIHTVITVRSRHISVSSLPKNDPMPPPTG